MLLEMLMALNQLHASLTWTLIVQWNKNNVNYSGNFLKDSDYMHF